MALFCFALGVWSRVALAVAAVSLTCCVGILLTVQSTHDCGIPLITVWVLLGVPCMTAWASSPSWLDGNSARRRQSLSKCAAWPSGFRGSRLGWRLRLPPLTCPPSLVQLL